MSWVKRIETTGKIDPSPQLLAEETFTSPSQLFSMNITYQAISLRTFIRQPFLMCLLGNTHLT